MKLPLAVALPCSSHPPRREGWGSEAHRRHQLLDPAFCLRGTVPALREACYEVSPARAATLHGSGRGHCTQHWVALSPCLSLIVSILT